METIILNVPDMSCSHCELTIKNAVKKLDGVNDVSVNLMKKTVSVTFMQGKTNDDSIKAAIIDQGYEIG